MWPPSWYFYFDLFFKISIWHTIVSYSNVHVAVMFYGRYRAVYERHVDPRVSNGKFSQRTEVYPLLLILGKSNYKTCNKYWIEKRRIRLQIWTTPISPRCWHYLEAIGMITLVLPLYTEQFLIRYSLFTGPMRYFKSCVFI